MNMKLLAVVIPPSIYHGCYTWKMFWEGEFIDEEILLLAVNMTNCGRHNVIKHKEMFGSDKYVTLYTTLKFDSLDMMKITYSGPKGKLKRSGKGLITSLGLMAKVRPQKYKKLMYAIKNVITKDLSKII